MFLHPFLKGFLNVGKGLDQIESLSSNDKNRGYFFIFDRPVLYPLPQKCVLNYIGKKWKKWERSSVLLKIILKEAFSVNCALICCTGTLTKDIVVLSGE